MVLEPNEELGGTVLGTFDLNVKREKKLMLKILKIYRNKTLSNREKMTMENTVFALSLPRVIFLSLLSVFSPMTHPFSSHAEYYWDYFFFLRF